MSEKEEKSDFVNLISNVVEGNLEEKKEENKIEENKIEENINDQNEINTNDNNNNNNNKFIDESNDKKNKTSIENNTDNNIKINFNEEDELEGKLKIMYEKLEDMKKQNKKNVSFNNSTMNKKYRQNSYDKITEMFHKVGIEKNFLMSNNFISKNKEH